MGCSKRRYCDRKGAKEGETQTQPCRQGRHRSGLEKEVGGKKSSEKGLGKRCGGDTRRGLSAAARKRIAAAPRKRWAEYRAKGGRKSGSAKATARKPVPPEVRQKRIAALGKARAAKAQKKTAAATA
jgi:hypothetical protein